MKRLLLLLSCCVFVFLQTAAQSASRKKIRKSDTGIDLSASIQLPSGDFASTHLIGWGIGVSPSYHTTGLFSKIKNIATCKASVPYLPLRHANFRW